MRRHRIIIIILSISFLFTSCCRMEQSADENQGNGSSQEEPYTFYVRCLDEVRLEGRLAEDFYITNTGNLWGLYYINDENQLYGYRIDSDMQSGAENDNAHTGMQLIAEDVVHVDCGGLSNFTVFLTTEGKLYGIGHTSSGVLLSDRKGYFEEPMLLMDEVKYALCGEENIVVLKNDCSVWTWGTMVDNEGREYAENVPSPVKILENAVMISGKRDSFAALHKDGTVWVWGNNTYDKCGVAGEGVIKEPVCVASNVTAVWMGKLQANALCTDWEKWCHYGYDGGYRDNLVIKKEDGSLWTCGKNIEDSENGREKEGIAYTHIFVPCRIKQAPYIVYDGLNTYQSVLEEYERAQEDETYTPEHWKKVDYTFSFYSFYKEKNKLYYSLKDLTDDGTEELILALKEEGKYIVKAIYAYDEGTIVTVENHMENIEHELYGQGIIKSIWYGGSGRTYYTFERLQKNSGLKELLVKVYDIPGDWGFGDEERVKYYKCAGAKLDDEEEITEEEFLNIMNQYGTGLLDLEWHLVDGFWDLEEAAY